MENEKYIDINIVARAKGLKSNRSIRLEINKPCSKYIAREQKLLVQIKQWKNRVSIT